VKVLFIANTPDMSSGFLWDGLQSVLGVDNVADGLGAVRDEEGWRRWETGFRGKPEGMWANNRPIVWNTKGHRFPFEGEDDFDLLIAGPTFLRERGWEWLQQQKNTRLKPGGKFVWFETLDGCLDSFPPPFPVDAVFRRELDPGVPYPYDHKPLSLLCATPRRWFDDPVYGWTDQKPFDVFNVSNASTTGWPVRWQSLSPTFCTKKKYYTLAGAGCLQPPTVYLHLARMFKLIVDTPGAEGASDNGRTWETISLGGIPVFVQQSCRPRWPWFTPEHMIWVDRPESLPAAIEKALEETDLAAMRLRLKAHALEHHTTEARARQFLRMVEEDAYHGAPGPWRW
jgi:hypothetical protein